MEHLVSEILTGASGAGAYGLVLGVLLLCGLGVPLPEDVVLVTGGYLVFEGAAKLPIMLLVGFAGILGGDSIAFGLGRVLGERVTQVWPFRLIVTPAKRTRVEHLFARYGNRIVVAARFMPGVRAVTYFIAGSARLPYLTFISFDAAAALISAPLFILLGWHFGGEIEWIIRAVRRGQMAVIGAIVGILAVWLLARYVRKRLSRDKAERLAVTEESKEVAVLARPAGSNGAQPVPPAKESAPAPVDVAVPPRA